MTKKRLTWVDATKGFLMILVVIGHYPEPEQLDHPLLTYIYWFHMPAFFVLSGLFFRPADSNISMWQSIKKRSIQLLVPYIFFVFIITCLRYVLAFINGTVDFDYYKHDLLTILFGGRFARGSYGVIWFITTLFFTYIAFLFVTRYLNRVNQILFLMLCYILAELESFYVVYVIGGNVDEASQTILVPWDLDVVLIAIVYFAIGYYAKEIFLHVRFPLWIICIAITLMAMRLTWNEELDYHLSMKFIRYSHPILDLALPIAFLLVIFGFFQLITKYIRFKILEFIEMHSIAIMYLHISVDKFMNDFIEYGLFGYTLICLIIPLIISVIVQRFMPYASPLMGNFRFKKWAKS
ncbi:acyltransferase family protein [Rummeliibacillus suwonensis]|uniref:acyltransferase family protein n=1 Tax=Rummeliibacillus suwonensis TaxID=1306154 RepID=UPI0011B62308|nr:acyltransferase family protein [Rummeliibacillus suwonensis]